MCELQKIATGYTREDEIEVIAALDKIHASDEKLDEFGVPVAPRTYVVISFVEYDDGVSHGVALFDVNQPVMSKGKNESAKIIANASVSSVAALLCAKDMKKAAADNLDHAQNVQLGARLFCLDEDGMRKLKMKGEMSEQAS